MFGALGLQAPLSHVAGAPLLSAGQGSPPGVQDVEQTWMSPKFWHTMLSQSCSALQRS